MCASLCDLSAYVCVRAFVFVFVHLCVYALCAFVYTCGVCICQSVLGVAHVFLHVFLDNEARVCEIYKSKAMPLHCNADWIFHFKDVSATCPEFPSLPTPTHKQLPDDYIQHANN